MELLKKTYFFLLDITQSLVIFFAIFLVIYIFLFRPFQVSGNSMFPTFHDKEYVLTNLITLRFNDLKLGDVVVFKAPLEPEKDYIKRIIGIPGDKVAIRNGEVYLNGSLLDQSAFLDSSVNTYPGAFLKENQEVVVPIDSYFVIGDNRSGSSDSREWGFVSRDLIIGKSFFAYWPLDRIRVIKNPYN